LSAGTGGRGRPGPVRRGVAGLPHAEGLKPGFATWSAAPRGRRGPRAAPRPAHAKGSPAHAKGPPRKRERFAPQTRTVLENAYKISFAFSKTVRVCGAGGEGRATEHRGLRPRAGPRTPAGHRARRPGNWSGGQAIG